MILFYSKMLQILRYNPQYKNSWDEQVRSSRNGTFLFYRDYMDYHSDRFIDSSFLFFRNGKISSVIPGNIENGIYYSHQGLTYGGLISSDKLNTLEVLELFELLNIELRLMGLQAVIYKPVPIIYHKIPAQEDVYALFRYGAEKIACNISSTIFQVSKIKFTESRKSGIRKSKREGVEIAESIDFNAFWKILEDNLAERFNTKPVHNLSEIELLKYRFPENIKLYVVKKSGLIIGGTVLYVMSNILHVQYISANSIGKEVGALDFLFDWLINYEFKHIPIFDFGQSTEKMGHILNENLIFQKEGFGGRAIVYETYKYRL